MNTNPLAAAPTSAPAAAPADAAKAGPERWRDPSAPVAERVCDLLSRMTLEEKLGQLGSAWLSEPGDGTGRAPMQGEFTDGLPPFTEMIRHGLGQLTRVFGTRPVEPEAGVRQLARLQAQI